MTKRLHRWISLALAVFWLVQALTGIAIVFRWELDDASITAPAVAADPAALAARIETLRREGSTVSSMWASGNDASRFDIFHERGGASLTTRVDGAGAVLRTRGDERVANGGVWDTLTRIHQSLLAGDAGEWIVGVSGFFLLTNLILGVRLAWPRRWRAALLTRPAGNRVARNYGWHRLLGLWVAIPAIATVLAGLLLVFHHGLEEALGVEHEPRAATVTSESDIGPAGALGRALALYPGATISGLSLPEAAADPYRIRLNVPGETGRIYGATTVVVAPSGEVLLNHDARRASGARAFTDTLYPFHTGQAGGAIGRALTLALGLWLLTMIVLGIRLWWLRRRPSR